MGYWTDVFAGMTPVEAAAKQEAERAEFREDGDEAEDEDEADEE